jgi:hypothetical protein
MPEDRYFTEVVIILEPLDDEQMKGVVGDLQSRGLRVDSSDSDNSVVEGTIESSRLHELSSAPFVDYVRQEFTYVAEFPTERQSGRRTSGDVPPPESPNI